MTRIIYLPELANDLRLIQLAKICEHEAERFEDFVFRQPEIGEQVRCRNTEIHFRIHRR